MLTDGCLFSCYFQPLYYLDFETLEISTVYSTGSNYTGFIDLGTKLLVYNASQTSWSNSYRLFLLDKETFEVSVLLTSVSKVIELCRDNDYLYVYCYGTFFKFSLTDGSYTSFRHTVDSFYVYDKVDDTHLILKSGLNYQTIYYLFDAENFSIEPYYFEFEDVA